MASFVTPIGTGTFRFAAGDGMIQRFVKTLNYNLEHRPFSDEDVLDIGGFSAPTLNAPVIVLAANSAVFESLLGQLGTLTSPSFSTTARLLVIGAAHSNFDATHYFYDTLWLKTL